MKLVEQVRRLASNKDLALFVFALIVLATSVFFWQQQVLHKLNVLTLSAEQPKNITLVAPPDTNVTLIIPNGTVKDLNGLAKIAGVGNLEPIIIK